MAKIDIYSDLSPKVTVKPQFINSNTTITGTGVDLQGFEGALVVISAGTIAGSGTANVYTPEVQESNSSDTGFTAVADADLVGTEAAAVHNGGTDSTCLKIGYTGIKRYIRVVLTTTAFTTAGGYIGADVIKGAPHVGAV